MIKIAICDDEKYFVDTVEKMLKIYAEKNGKDFVIKKEKHLSFYEKCFVFCLNPIISPSN